MRTKEDANIWSVQKNRSERCNGRLASLVLICRILFANCSSSYNLALSSLECHRPHLLQMTLSQLPKLKKNRILTKRECGSSEKLISLPQCQVYLFHGKQFSSDVAGSWILSSGIPLSFYQNL